MKPTPNLSTFYPPLTTSWMIEVDRWEAAHQVRGWRKLPKHFKVSTSRHGPNRRIKVISCTARKTGALVAELHLI